MTAETSNARGEWPERYACNGPEGTFWTDDAALANKLIGAAFDRDEWTVTDTQNPTGAAPSSTAKPEARGVVDEDALRDARTIYDIACIRENRDNATREDVEFKAICLRNYNRIAAIAQQPAATSGEAGAFDANFLQSVASLCRAAYDLCQPKPQRTPEDPREHYGELCLLELTSIADEIERRLAAAEGVQPAAVDGAYPTPRNRAEAVALARLALAHLGVIDAHIDAAIARCETNSATQRQEPKS